MNLNRRSFIRHVGTASLFMLSMGPTASTDWLNVFTDIWTGHPWDLPHFRTSLRSSKAQASSMWLLAVR